MSICECGWSAPLTVPAHWHLPICPIWQTMEMTRRFSEAVTFAEAVTRRRNEMLLDEDLDVAMRGAGVTLPPFKLSPPNPEDLRPLEAEDLMRWLDLK